MRTLPPLLMGALALLFGSGVLGTGYWVLGTQVGSAGLVGWFRNGTVFEGVSRLLEDKYTSPVSHPVSCFGRGNISF